MNLTTMLAIFNYVFLLLQVWSSNAGETHDSQTHNYVMKGQRWMVADSMSTTLIGKVEEVMYE